jgi:2,4-dienoyl-CoA reductase-like NADH-dependent reductase (Old Yellow Enzyme family)
LIGVRLSAFDFIPYKRGLDGIGQAEEWPRQSVYPYAFGGDGSGSGIDLYETNQFLSLLESMGVLLVNLSAGSPYYCPHIQRPALFPPIDGYLPPEDPLVGVARQIQVAAELKARHPRLIFVGSAYSYLQEWLPHIAQWNVRRGGVDFVGIGRMALTYPTLCADVLAGRPLQRKRICRTFSDCTTAPRLGFVSGCFPLDDFYKNRPEAKQLAAIKRKLT